MNNVAKNGVGIYSEFSTVIFDKDSNVRLINNSVEQNGAALFMKRCSNSIFKHNSRVQFINNKGTNGIVYSDDKSKVIFTAMCHVTFSGNT